MKNLIYTVCLLFVSLWVSAKPFTLEEQSDIVSSVTIHSRSVLIEETNDSLSQKDKSTLFALKSNLLYDLATFFNISVEFPFKVQNQYFSVVAQHQFPWYVWGGNKYCLRFLSSGGELRWWFKPNLKEETATRLKRDALVGHFVGIYGLGGKYDVQNKSKYCYQGEFWSTGLVYGYSTPIAKRVNLEFTIALGYASIPYRHYIPSEDYKTLYLDVDKVGVWHYFGPTRIEVSLSIPIYKNKKKGGKQ
ncbi:MAG: DUF3575 domain-containing protein [Parabacteroides sp.]|nr:DUF3575 domain-containing protein [Parabacteroides sp.]